LELKFSGLKMLSIKPWNRCKNWVHLLKKTVCKISDEELVAFPAELAQDIAKRIRDAAEMGDVTTVNSIAAEIKRHSNSCVPLSNQIVQLAGEFDLEGIQKLVDTLDA
jgi:hypothetical protein